MAAVLEDYAERDEADLARFVGLYGLDYRDKGFYDLVVDTTDMEEREKVGVCEEAVDKFLKDVGSAT